MELRNKGLASRTATTAAGKIELVRRHFWAKGEEGVCPVDAKAGVDGALGAASAGIREIACVLGLSQPFRQAAANLKRLLGIDVSAEWMRQILEETGRMAQEKHDSGELPAAWTAADAKMSPEQKTLRNAYAAAQGQPAPAAPPGTVPDTHLNFGADGVYAPTVTQTEKTKRRANHEARRKARDEAGIGNTKPLPPARPGTEEKSREMKIGVFYDQSKELKHCFVTDGPCEVFGPLLKEHAGQVQAKRAANLVGVWDGAVWIMIQVQLALGCLGHYFLDFYHMSEHVNAAAKACFGAAQAGKDWVALMLATIKRQGPEPVLQALDDLYDKTTDPEKRKAIDGLRGYLGVRKGQLHYPQALAQGWDIGSGPTEAECKTLSMRLRRTGMKWDPDNACAIMNLAAVRESGQNEALWSALRHAA